MKFFQFSVILAIVMLFLMAGQTEAGLGHKIHKAIKHIKHGIHEAAGVAGDAAAVVAGGAAVGAAMG